MEKYRFEQGARIIIDGKRYRLLSEVSVVGEQVWQFMPIVNETPDGSFKNALVERASERDLQKWLAEGKLEFDSERDGDTPQQAKDRLSRRQLLLSDKDPKVRTRIEFRLEVIKEVEKRAPCGLRTTPCLSSESENEKTVLKRVLHELGRELGQKYFGHEQPISQATYYRWKEKYEIADDSRDLEGDFHLRGRRNQIPKLVKDIIVSVIREKVITAQIRKNGEKPTLTMLDIMDESLKRIDKLRADFPAHAANFRFPSKTTFYDFLNGNTTAYERSLAMHGRTWTRNDFRKPHGREPPEACLSQVQFDETRLDIYCFDDVLGIPLGRPWLAWLVDVYSRVILGFYLGFEPPGDLVLASVIRHAVVPKPYIAEAYPDIKGNICIGGFPRFVTFDNSLQAHGNTITRIFKDIDTPWDFSPPREPWTKWCVEGMNSSINTALLRECPGVVLPYEIDGHDYDPTKNGRIGFMHLLWILHKWIYEVHHNDQPPGAIASPAQLWDEGTRHIKPQFARKRTDLDLLFGIEREATLDHRGIVFESIRYYDDGVDILRRHKGSRLKVRVKINPLDLGWIHVYDKDLRCYIPCRAIEENYAIGLDLYRHQLYRKHALRRYGRQDLEARIRARAELRDLIGKSLLEDYGIRVNELIARSAGIGTHTIFNLLDYDGRLPQLNRFFPICQQSILIPEQPQPFSGREVRSPELNTKLQADARNLDSPKQSDAPKPQRIVPVFRTDRSLGR